MMLRLNPTVPIVWRDPYCLQVGVDVPVCTLNDTTTATQRMLAALAVGVPRPALSVVGTNAGASETEVAALLAAVRPALLPDSSDAPRRPVIALDGDSAPLPRLHELISDSGMDTVAAADADDGTVDAAVIVARFAITPAQHGAWLRRDIPHLPVVFGDRLVRIGPFVEPGLGPCIHCIELEQVDTDAAWPAMATQLVGKSAAAQTALACADAAVRVVRMLRARTVDDSRSYAARSIVVDAGSGDVSERSHRWHPRCGCRVLPENVTVLDDPRALNPVVPNSTATDGAHG